MAIAAYSAIHGVTGDALVARAGQGVKLLYWGSIILGLGNGSVEAYINPVVATLFNKDKVKWLNILHAGWPAGLVLGGLCTIALTGNPDWRIALGLILIPALIFCDSDRQAISQERTRTGGRGLFGHAQGTGGVWRASSASGWYSRNWAGVRGSHTVSWILTGVVVPLLRPSPNRSVG